MVKKSKYRNKFEADGAKQLKRAKVSFRYEQRKIAYVRAHHYTPDFEVDTPLGSIIIEFKGYFRVDDRAKMVAVKRQHPNLDIRFVFYKEVPAYIRWAEKHGFKWAVGKIPKEWLKGL